MSDSKALAETVHEALVRLEAAEAWFRHVDAGDCDLEVANDAAGQLVIDAREWLAKAAVP